MKIENFEIHIFFLNFLRMKYSKYFFRSWEKHKSYYVSVKPIRMFSNKMDGPVVFVKEQFWVLNASL
jgi:hypothetical protein